MDDLSGGFPFSALLGLGLLILIFGILVKTRLARAGAARAPDISTAVIVLLALGLAFFSIFMPRLAAFPALLFMVRGLLAFVGRGRQALDWQGGFVIVLVGLAWAALTWLQIDLLAWGETVHGAIRVDIVITAPMMAVASYIGWTIQWALPVRRLT